LSTNNKTAICGSLTKLSPGEYISEEKLLKLIAHIRKMTIIGKVPYICAPLTELLAEEQVLAKRLYELLADACLAIFGARAFVPHEHFDPQKHANYTPTQVDRVERKQVCEKTSLLIVVAVAPSWGGGIEVEMANENDVPVIILCERKKLEQRKVSRLLRGNPAVKATIPYDSNEEAVKKFMDIFLSVSVKN